MQCIPCIQGISLHVHVYFTYMHSETQSYNNIAIYYVSYLINRANIKIHMHVTHIIDTGCSTIMCYDKADSLCLLEHVKTALKLISNIHFISILTMRHCHNYHPSQTRWSQRACANSSVDNALFEVSLSRSSRAFSHSRHPPSLIRSISGKWQRGDCSI